MSAGVLWVVYLKSGARDVYLFIWEFSSSRIIRKDLESLWGVESDMKVNTNGKSQHKTVQSLQN